MAGHSKWANIKHKKGAADQKRAKVFTKIAKEIVIAAKLGGGEEDANPRLRRAIAAAKAVSMPKDNIQKAVKRGTGELEGVEYEEISFEGYGPGGIAILVDCLTDNRNRTVHEVRFAFNKGGGSMGEIGCVNYMFEQKAVFSFDKAKVNLEALQDLAIESGVEDIEEDEEFITFYSGYENFDHLREVFENQAYEASRSEITKIPSNTVQIEGEQAEAVLKLIEMLEDNDDVQNVYANFDISDEELNRISS